MSWGGDEFSGETDFDSCFTTPSGHWPASRFWRPPATTEPTSDSRRRSRPQYPACSPNVVAVGGTSFIANRRTATPARPRGRIGEAAGPTAAAAASVPMKANLPTKSGVGQCVQHDQSHLSRRLGRCQSLTRAWRFTTRGISAATTPGIDGPSAARAGLSLVGGDRDDGRPGARDRRLDVTGRPEPDTAACCIRCQFHTTFQRHHISTGNTIRAKQRPSLLCPDGLRPGDRPGQPGQCPQRRQLARPAMAGPSILAIAQGPTSSLAGASIVPRLPWMSKTPWAMSSRATTAT